jgi:hypothetical protein
MTIILPIPSFIAGLIAGLLYMALHHGLIVGVTAPFLPVFVIALSGMSFGRAGILLTILTTIPIILTALPLYDAILIIGGQLLPLFLLIRHLQTVIWTLDPPTLRWSSPATAVAATALYGAGFYGTMIGSGSGLYGYVSAALLGDIRKGFPSLDPQMAVTMEGLIQQIPHLLLAVDFWVWVLMTYGVVALANGVAHTLGYGRRPHMRLPMHTPPNYVLGVLGAAALLGGLSANALTHAGQAASVILLIPYFFSGLGYANARLRALPNSSAWMIGFYLLFFLFNVWPLLLVTMLGLGRHVAQYSATIKVSRK